MNKNSDKRDKNKTLPESPFHTEGEGEVPMARSIKAACVVGLFVFIIFSGLLVWTLIGSKTGIFGSKNQFDSISFNEKLKTFDTLLDDALTERTEPAAEIVTALLDSLEKTAVGAEGQLSVLKRRRLLAGQFPAYLGGYHLAAERAVQKFPHSAPLAAIAGDALVSQAYYLERAREERSPNAPLSGASGDTLNAYAKVLARSGPLVEKSFLPLAFAFRALSASFSSAGESLTVERFDDLFASAVQNADGAAFEGLSIDAALLKIVQDQLQEARAYLIPLGSGSVALEENASPKSAGFFAMYSYDFGNLLLAAEIWTKKGRDEDLARAADAFYLAKLTENARQLWQTLTGSGGNVGSGTRLAAFYNLAHSAARNEDKITPLQNLLAESQDIATPAVLNGIILYTRLLGDERARAVLHDNPATAATPLLDLELFRRSISSMPVNRSVAETWLLLDRHIADPRIYQWAAWHFDYARRFDEARFLVESAEKRGIAIEGEWLAFNQAVFSIQNNDYAAASRFLESARQPPAPPSRAAPDGTRSESGIWGGEDKSAGPPWEIPANLGLILEAEHNFSAALGFFRQAAARLDVQNDAQPSLEKAALLQLRIARCLNVLGRKDEAREAVLKAAEFAPDNINVRIALGRL
jgi:tetratricopeptide (TPR) repeat protein